MTDLAAYRALIARKRVAFTPHGLDAVPPLHPALRPDQRHCVEFALRAGCSAQFLGTGMGKTFMALEFGRVVVEHIRKPVLMLAPLAVGHQHVREAERFGIDAQMVRSQDEVGARRIYVTNYERLDAFDLERFGGVVLDECFPAGTEIDVPGGKKRIEEIRKGDKILNCVGTDEVSDVHRREVSYAVQIEAGDACIVASPNHPIFTQRGWVGAQHLRPGDHALAAGAAVRLVRDDLRTEVPGQLRTAFLRDILLSEMAYDPAGSAGEGAFGRGGGEARPEEERVASVIGPEGGSGASTHSSTQSDIGSQGAGEDLPYIENHEASSFRTWGQWSRDDVRAISDDGCAWERLASGIQFVAGPTKSRLSHALQDRLRISEQEARDRGGWQLASHPSKEAGGREEGRDADFVRVDRLTVLERGDPRLDKFRDVDGKLYFYDLGATRHPSYSVQGLLVHNSSILKNFTGKTTRKLTAAFAHTPFRLACTATPAPNDHTELGQHAAFLGVMDSPEMLSRWFIADQAQMGRYRLKRAAVNSFWEWVASWARCATRPSDLGFSDDGFVLPSLEVVDHHVEADRSVDPGAERDGQQRLFRIPETSATSIHFEKRLSFEARADTVAAVVTAEPGEAWIVWVDTDYEADAVMARLLGAVEVRGSQMPEEKERRLVAFSEGRSRIIVTKPKLAGFGLNWQHCARQCFAGLSFSYESYHQAVRRSWRFGQARPVRVHVVCADTEAAIKAAVDRKGEDHEAMGRAMATAMRRASITSEVYQAYRPQREGTLPGWLAA